MSEHCTKGRDVMVNEEGHTGNLGSPVSTWGIVFICVTRKKKVLSL